MDFDLRTPDSAYAFVLSILGMSGEQFIDEYLLECNQDYEKFWIKHSNRLKHFDASRIRIWAFHITGSLDRCNSIKKIGLRNLRYALTTNSSMSRMFQKYGLEFDIPNKTMYFRGTPYDVDYDKYRNRSNLYGEDRYLKSIASRLYRDYCVNGFMCCDSPRDYGFDVCIRPEFIVDLLNMFPELCDLDLEWRQKSISYKVNFFVYLHQLERFNFDLDQYRDPPYNDWRNLNDNDKIVKWMLGRAIDRAFNELCDTYLFVKSDLYVPANQIFDCEKIETTSSL